MLESEDLCCRSWIFSLLFSGDSGRTSILVGSGLAASCCLVMIFFFVTCGDDWVACDQSWKSCWLLCRQWPENIRLKLLSSVFWINFFTFHISLNLCCQPLCFHGKVWRNCCLQVAGMFCCDKPSLNDKWNKAEFAKSHFLVGYKMGCSQPNVFLAILLLLSSIGLTPCYVVTHQNSFVEWLL